MQHLKITAFSYKSCLLTLPKMFWAQKGALTLLSCMSTADDSDDLLLTQRGNALSVVGNGL